MYFRVLVKQIIYTFYNDIFFFCFYVFKYFFVLNLSKKYVQSSIFINFSTLKNLFFTILKMFSESLKNEGQTPIVIILPVIRSICSFLLISSVIINRYKYTSMCFVNNKSVIIFKIIVVMHTPVFRMKQ